MTRTTIDRYLQTHAEAQASVYADKVAHRYTHAIVIPMFDEDSACLGRVLLHNEHADALVIAVVNAPDNADTGPLTRTRMLLTEIARGSPLDVLVVDCASAGLALSARQGVGLARKIGTDIALQLFADDKIVNPWLYQTDADAQLPAGYFATSLPAAGAVVFGHRHASADARLQRAAELYDLHMRHYTSGLAAAGSSYAYPTLGSTVTVHASAYAAVRGYPKRNAAEDFYLLNKVAKVAAVTYRPELRLTLRARLSTRVPFGTGPALEKICAGLAADPTGEFFLSYNPASFALLQDALRHLEDFAGTPRAAPDKIGRILAQLGFDAVRDNIATKYPTAARRRYVLRQWFDAGKTLRFMHAARRYHEDQPLLRTLRSIPRKPGAGNPRGADL